MQCLKEKRFSSEEYKSFIRKLQCCVSNCSRRRNSKNNKPEVDPHHTKSVGSGGSDLTCVPACDRHHTESHTIGQDTFQERYDIDFKEIQIECLKQFIESKLKGEML